LEKIYELQVNKLLFERANRFFWVSNILILISALYNRLISKMGLFCEVTLASRRAKATGNVNQLFKMVKLIAAA
jgi:hypothetical protein